jgi:NAD(P)H-dependent FMN reductase
MAGQKVNIGVIVASTRPKRYGGQIADWVKTVTDADDEANYTYLDLKDINLPFLDEPRLPAEGNYEYEHTKRWAKQVADQDGFFIITAEYNHGIPAPLKNALDVLYAEWRNKPVGFLGYGAMGGARVIEQLVNVTVNLDMIPQNSSGKGTHIMLFQSLNDKGEFVANDHHENSLKKNLANLKKWTRILRDIRENEDL